jgi:hypothetical protein
MLFESAKINAVPTSVHFVMELLPLFLSSKIPNQEMDWKIVLSGAANLYVLSTTSSVYQLESVQRI